MFVVGGSKRRFFALSRFIDPPRGQIAHAELRLAPICQSLKCGAMRSQGAAQFARAAVVTGGF